jgi:hypothetical protein
LYTRGNFGAIDKAQMNAIQIGGKIEIKGKKVKVKGARVIDHGKPEIEQIKEREKARKVKLPKSKP